MSEEYGMDTVSLKDGFYIPTQDVLAKTIWLKCRNTSVTYIERMVELLENFTKGYAAFISKESDPGRMKDHVSRCYHALKEFKSGLARIRKEDHSGYPLVAQGLNFRIPFCERFDDTDFSPLGYSDEEDDNGKRIPPKGLWCWIDRAVKMNIPIEFTLSGQLWFPSVNVVEKRFPSKLGGFPFGNGTTIKTGDGIPTTGVWIPKGMKRGARIFS